MAFEVIEIQTSTDLNINLLPELTRNHVYMLPAFILMQAKKEGAKAKLCTKIQRQYVEENIGTTILVNYSRVHNMTNRLTTLCLDAQELLVIILRFLYWKRTLFPRCTY